MTFDVNDVQLASCVTESYTEQTHLIFFVCLLSFCLPIANLFVYLSLSVCLSACLPSCLIYLSVFVCQCVCVCLSFLSVCDCLIV